MYICMTHFVSAFLHLDNVNNIFLWNIKTVIRTVNNVYICKGVHVVNIDPSG